MRVSRFVRRQRTRRMVACGLLLFGLVALSPAADAGGDAATPGAGKTSTAPSTKGEGALRVVERCTKIIDNPATSSADRGDALKERSAAHGDLGEFEQAASDLSAAIALSPRDVSLQVSRSLYRLYASDFEGAEADADAVIRVVDVPSSRGLRGMIRVLAGKFDLALVDLDAAIGPSPSASNVPRTLDPSTLATSLDLRADAFASLGKPEQASKDYAAAIRIDPDRAEAYAARGLFEADLGMADEAMADLDHAVAMESGSNALALSALSSRGEANFFLGRYKLAIEDFDKVLANSSDFRLIYFDRGVAKYQLGEFSVAIQDFQRAIATKGSVYIPEGDLKERIVSWLHLARLQSRIDDRVEFAQNASSIDLAKWPGPVVEYFQGKLSVDQLREAAERGQPYEIASQKCDAALFPALDMAAAGKSEVAKTLLGVATDTCPPRSAGRSLARALLKPS